MRKKKKWMTAAIWILAAFLIGGAAFAIHLSKTVYDTAKEIHKPIERKTEKREEQVSTKKKDPFSVLLLGVDERENDRGRADTIIVATVNPEQKSIKLLSIPRDTYVEIPGREGKDKINHSYAFGGSKLTVETVEKFLDIPIDYYVKVNMEGFRDIIDALGGVTVDNDMDLIHGPYHFPKGEIELNGEEALVFSRIRYEDPRGDFGRQLRQKQIVQAIINRGASLSSLWNYADIFRALGRNVETNFTFSEIVDLQKNYSDVRNNIEQLRFEGEKGGYIGQYWYYFADEEEVANFRKILLTHLGIASDENQQAG